MAIIQFPSTDYKNIKDSVNELIDDSLKHTLDIQDIVSRSPDILAGHDILRVILRDVKRGISLEEAIKKSAGVECPPKDIDLGECNERKCTDCWLEYIQAYHDLIINKKNLN